MNLIHSKVHAVIDYVFDLVFLIAPTALGFSTTVSVLCYCIAAAHFVTSLCTKYEFSLVKAISFPLHGKIEIVAAVVLVLAPWVVGFADELIARNFFVAFGLILSIVWGLTDYNSAYRSKALVETTDTSLGSAPTLPFRRVG